MKISRKMLPEEYVPFCAEIKVPNVDDTVHYYENMLLFNLIRINPEKSFAILKFHESILMVAQYPKSKSPLGGGVQLRFIINEDLNKYHDALVKKGVNITRGIEKRPYGLTTFFVEDPWGFELKFCNKTRTP